MSGNPNVVLNPGCSWLPFEKNAWMTQKSDGTLLSFETIESIDGNGTQIWKPVLTSSGDDGLTWSEPCDITVVPDTFPHWLAECRIIIQTKSGVLVMIYEDLQNCVWKWDENTHLPDKTSRLNVWACRSVDDGRTWSDHTLLVDGWCGALIDIKQLSAGRICATVMDMLYEQGRHYSFTVVSDDDGRTWLRGNNLDMGGHGDHDGAMEPTFVELKNGRVMMLIRTTLDQFWVAYSDDGGRYFRELRPSGIDASSSPGFLLRLKSGKIALVWNRLCAEGQSEPIRGEINPNRCEIAESWQRAELSIAFSDDECETWSTPVVIARNKAGQIAYPYMLERKPGEIWVIARAPSGGPICFNLQENNF